MASEENEDASGLKIYSLGIVVKTPSVLGSAVIDVSPVEHLNAQTPGLIEDQENVYTNLHPNGEGTVNQSEIKAKNYIKATWLPFGHSNRSTPPNVQKNESVIIWKFGNVDTYYWTTTFHEPSIRRQEKVRYVFNNMKGGLGGSNDDTMYWFEVDTVGKKITLRTADNDREKTRYKIELDTAKAVLTIKDEQDNIIKLETQDDRLTISTKNDIIVKAENKITFDSPAVAVKGTFYVEGDSSTSGTHYMSSKVEGSSLDTPASIDPSKKKTVTAANSIDSQNLSSLFGSLLGGTPTVPSTPSTTSVAGVSAPASSTTTATPAVTTPAATFTNPFASLMPQATPAASSPAPAGSSTQTMSNAFTGKSE